MMRIEDPAWQKQPRNYWTWPSFNPNDFMDDNVKLKFDYNLFMQDTIRKMVDVEEKAGIEVLARFLREKGYTVTKHG